MFYRAPCFASYFVQRSIFDSVGPTAGVYPGGSFGGLGPRVTKGAPKKEKRKEKERKRGKKGKMRKDKSI